MTALANLTLAPTVVRRADRESARQAALDLLRTMGLEHRATRKPSQLSGGEQQRVAIARALAMQPAYLLYDEPTSSLDPERAREIWGIMAALAESGQTQIIVTHQEDLATHLPCRVVRMVEGRVVESGSN